MRGALDDGVVEIAAHGDCENERLLTSRLSMRRVHRFGLWRPSLSQIHRQPDHRGNRQELALPILKRLEPEFRRRQVVGESGTWLMMRRLVGGTCRKAAERVYHPCNQEEQHERQAE